MFFDAISGCRPFNIAASIGCRAEDRKKPVVDSKIIAAIARFNFRLAGVKFFKINPHDGRAGKLFTEFVPEQPGASQLWKNNHSHPVSVIYDN
jgi:hypothetical protein